jgi:hypothetical protein
MLLKLLLENIDNFLSISLLPNKFFSIMRLSPEVTDSLTLKFAQLAREKNQTGERIISLGLGEPGF